VSVLVLVLLPCVGALLAPLLARVSRRLCAVACGLTVVVALGWLAWLAPAAYDGSGLVLGWPWMPEIGLDLLFRLDGLALLFALLILAIGLLVVVYTHFYLRHEVRYGRFYAYLMFFMGAMLGIVVSENVLLLSIFWELTSITSFLLIGFYGERRASRVGAITALTVTGGGGLALLAGFLLLGHAAGSFQLTDILASREAIAAHPLHVPILILILLGVFTKSAQFPFHFWLPPAMAAPTPVSAYLHSAAMVKAGVFLLARLHPALAGDALWLYMVAGTGMVTLVFGAFVAMFRHDVKGLLAYSTISHLGLIVFLFGLDHPLALVAGLLHVVNHATFKASLFMAAGIVSHESGSRDTRRLAGLWRRMPHTAVLVGVATASMAGVPLLNGFISKEMFFSEALAASRLGWIAPASALAFGVFSVAYSTRFIHDVFFHGKPGRLPKSPHEPRRGLRAPVEVLVAFCILIGIAPSLILGTLLERATRSALQSPPPQYDLAVWHGFNLPLAMSVASLAGGIVLYAWLQQRFHLHRHTSKPSFVRRAFNAGANGAFAGSQRLTTWLERGSLSVYVAVTLVVALAAGVWAFGPEHLAPPFALAPPTAPSAFSYVALLALLIAVLGSVWFRHEHLVAVVFVGGAGLMVALGFLRFSAPDLGLTQLCIEMVSVVLLLLALRRLPATERGDRGSRVVLQGVLAAGVGLAMGALAYATMVRPLASISDYYIAHAEAEAGGRNVVNVILVDFRGFDTLGEITVLAIAAIAIVTITGSRVRPLPDRADEPGIGDREGVSEGDSLIMASAVRVLVPLLLLLAAFLLLRGHDHPGGGFIAGLVTAIAMILQYLASGLEWATQRLRIVPRLWMSAGALLALATGLGSVIMGRPFLTSAHGKVHLPLVGEVGLSTTLLFDIGVYLVVVSAVLVYLAGLGRFTPAPSTGERAWK